MRNIAPESVTMSESPVHVAVGVVENEHGDILIAKRPDHLHQGGLWEFPGGKVEQGESVLAALKREFIEEVALQVSQSDPLIRIPYSYPDKKVLLDVHKIKSYQGDAHGQEGQEIRWVAKEQLIDYEFPAANRTIVQCLRLPEIYLITGKFADLVEFQVRLETALQGGVRLVQLRTRQTDSVTLEKLVKSAKQLCYSYQAKLFVNTTPEFAIAYELDGVHLNSVRLMQCAQRPLPDDKWVAASVHNEAELQHALDINADLVVVSPVLPTPSHPGEAGLGWEAFHALTEQASMPVYALGGMSEKTIAQAKTLGAQGIAGISNWW